MQEYRGADVHSDADEQHRKPREMQAGVQCHFIENKCREHARPNLKASSIPTRYEVSPYGDGDPSNVQKDGANSVQYEGAQAVL